MTHISHIAKSGGNLPRTRYVQIKGKFKKKWNKEVCLQRAGKEDQFKVKYKLVKKIEIDHNWGWKQECYFIYTFFSEMYFIW